MKLGKSEREKGHGFEREVARALRWIFHRCERGFQTRGGTKDEPDVKNTPFYIECKAERKMPSVRGALIQAEEATDGRIPVAICKKDREEPIVAMRMNHWLFLLEHGVLRDADAEVPKSWREYMK